MDLQATLAVSFIGRGRARNGEVGLARFGSYRKPCMLPSLPPVQHATLPASADVTAVTGYSSSTPIIFWTPCAPMKRPRGCFRLLNADSLEVSHLRIE